MKLPGLRSFAAVIAILAGDTIPPPDPEPRPCESRWTADAAHWSYSQSVKSTEEITKLPPATAGHPCRWLPVGRQSRSMMGKGIAAGGSVKDGGEAA